MTPGPELGLILSWHAEQMAQTRAAELALTGYLQDLVRERRANPDDSIPWRSIAAEEVGDRLSQARW